MVIVPALFRKVPHLGFYRYLGIAERHAALAARHRRHRLDRHSFYFIHLDLSLKHHAKLPAGVKGEAWQVHGGGFYQMIKFMVAPSTHAGRTDLVQMGSLRDLAVRLRAAGRGLLLQRRAVSDRQGGLGFERADGGAGRLRQSGGGLARL